MAGGTKRTKTDKSLLNDVPVDKVFWCQDGRILNSLDDLAFALKAMSDDTYNYHVNRDKNDFSNWIRDVIKDTALASDLAKTATRTGAVRKVESKLRSIRVNS